MTDRLVLTATWEEFDNSFVVGKYVIELTEAQTLQLYRIPNSTPPDFGPKYTVVDLFPEQKLESYIPTILGFCDMLRGFAQELVLDTGCIDRHSSTTHRLHHRD